MEYRIKASSPNHPLIDRLRDLTQQQTEIFYKLGYEEMAFYGANNLPWRLENSLRKAMEDGQTKGTTQELFVRVKGWHPDKESVSMLFHLQYRPKQEDLTWNSLTVNGDTMNRVVLIGKETPLPYAKKLLASMVSERNRKMLRRVFQKAGIPKKANSNAIKGSKTPHR